MEYVVSGFCESINYFKPMHLTFAWKKKTLQLAWNWHWHLLYCSGKGAGKPDAQISICHSLSLALFGDLPKATCRDALHVMLGNCILSSPP